MPQRSDLLPCLTACQPLAGLRRCHNPIQNISGLTPSTRWPDYGRLRVPLTERESL
jgi:hypothetical protein